MRIIVNMCVFYHVQVRTTTTRGQQEEMHIRTSLISRGLEDRIGQDRETIRISQALQFFFSFFSIIFLLWNRVSLLYQAKRKEKGKKKKRKKKKKLCSRSCTYLIINSRESLTVEIHSMYVLQKYENIGGFLQKFRYNLSFIRNYQDQSKPRQNQIRSLHNNDDHKKKKSRRGRFLQREARQETREMKKRHK